MELKDLRQDKDGREPYEPPNATFVPIKITERLLVCGLTGQYCGSNAYYQ